MARNFFLFLLLLELCGLALLALLFCLPEGGNSLTSHERLANGNVSDYFFLVRSAILFLWVSIFALFVMLWAFSLSFEL